MKKIVAFILFFSVITLNANSNQYTLCESIRDNSFFPDAKIHDSCLIDSMLRKYIKCRTLYLNSMNKGLNNRGEAEADSGNLSFSGNKYKVVDNYNFFDKEIKKVLDKEIKKYIAKNQDNMCINNSEASLLRYQESISEQEWCYRDEFYRAFNSDPVMNEHEMKYKYFNSFYRIRSAMLESKQKPKNKSSLCGVYLECMSSFINAEHTEVSSSLKSLYERTKKECRSNYYVVSTIQKYSSVSSKKRAEGSLISGPMVLVSRSLVNSKRKQIIHIDYKKGIVEVADLKEGAENRVEGQDYKLNKKICAYEKVIPPVIINNRLNPELTRLSRHNIMNADSKDAFLEFVSTNNQLSKLFRVPLSSLENGGSWSDSASLSKTLGTLNAGNSVTNSNFLRNLNRDISKGASYLGMSNSQRCTAYGFEILAGEFEGVKSSFNATININISPASVLDINNFSYLKDSNKIDSLRAKNIVVSKYEKETNGVFGSLESKMYENISRKDKKAWDSANEDVAQEREDKKNLEEFDNISIDDLEMFSN